MPHTMTRRRCELCNQVFDVSTRAASRARYCPDHRNDARRICSREWKRNHRGSVRRYRPREIKQAEPVITVRRKQGLTVANEYEKRSYDATQKRLDALAEYITTWDEDRAQELASKFGLTCRREPTSGLAA